MAGSVAAGVLRGARHAKPPDVGRTRGIYELLNCDLHPNTAHICYPIFRFDRLHDIWRPREIRRPCSAQRRARRLSLGSTTCSLPCFFLLILCPLSICRECASRGHCGRCAETWATCPLPGSPRPGKSVSVQAWAISYIHSTPGAVVCAYPSTGLVCMGVRQLMFVIDLTSARRNLASRKAPLHGLVPRIQSLSSLSHY